MKPRGLIERYAQFWEHRAPPRNVVELGIWEGGSAAFWFEAFSPHKHVAIDRAPRADSALFKEYLEKRGVGGRLKTCWGVDQKDQEAIRNITEQEFDASLDLVIDDASHLYEATRSSFDVLFPEIRPGGLYIVEDWQLGFVEDFVPPPVWGETELATRLIVELLESVARAHRQWPVSQCSRILLQSRRFNSRRKQAVCRGASSRRRTPARTSSRRSLETRMTSSLSEAAGHRWRLASTVGSQAS
jgi:hypothetical protein